MSNLKLMLVRFTFFSLVLFFGTSQLYAQTLGCLIGDNVYTQLNGNLNVTIIVASVNVRNFNNPSLSILSNACPRAVNITNVTAGGLAVTACVANNSLLPIGQTVNYTRLDPPVQCDLDDYTLPLAAAAGTLGLLVIRRRRHN